MTRSKRDLSQDLMPGKFCSSYSVLQSYCYALFRFGKVTWSKFSEDVYKEKFNIKELTELLFEKDRKHMTIFNTE